MPLSGMSKEKFNVQTQWQQQLRETRMSERMLHLFTKSQITAKDWYKCSGHLLQQQSSPLTFC